MAPDPAELVGHVIAERYALRAVIGSGGMGVVYRADDLEEDGREVAIKILTTTGDDLEGRFRREARVMSRLANDNVIAVHDAGSLEDGRPYIVMEHLRGESLEARQRRDPLTRDDALAVIAQVCGALRAVHAVGVVHRDLKPQNIFLASLSATGDKGGIGRVVVLDFGISKMLGSFTVETASSVLLGTPQYMAPEQARGDHELISPRSDIFSLGVIAYQLLARTMPFDGGSVYEIVYRIIEETPPLLATITTDCPVHVSNAVAVAMAKDPRDRFASAELFAAALRGDIAVEPPDTERVVGDTVATLADRPAAKRATAEPPLPALATRTRVAATIAVLVILVAGGLAAWSLTGRPKGVAITSAIISAREARELGDLGLEADAASNPIAALEFLSRAYHAGDRRLGIRIALRHRLWSAESLVFARRFESPIALLDITDDGSHIAVSTARNSYVFTSAGELVGVSEDENVRSFSRGKATYSGSMPAREKLHVTQRASGDIVYTVDGVSTYSWLDDRTVVTMSLNFDGLPLFIAHDVVAGKELWRRRCASRTELIYGQSGDGRRLIACDNPAILGENGEIVRELGEARTNEIQVGRLYLDFDGHLALIGRATAKPELVDVESGERLVLDGAPVGAASGWARFAPSGRMLITAHRGALDSFRIERNPLRATHLRSYGEAEGMESLTFVDEETILVGTTRGVVKLINAAGGATVGVLAGHQSPTDLLVHGNRVIVTAAGAELRVWRMREPLARVLLSDPTTEIHSAVDGKVILARHSEEWSRIDVDAGARVALESKPKLSDDRRTMIVGGRLVDVASGSELAKLPAGNWSISNVSDDGALVTVHQPIGLFRRTGDKYERVEFGDHEPSWIALSPTGEHAATITPLSKDRSSFTVEVVRGGDLEVVAKYRPPQGIPYTAFVGGDHLMFTVSGGLHLWDWRNNRGSTIAGGGAPLEGREGIVVMQRNGETLRFDLVARRPSSSTAACINGPVRLATGGLGAMRCRSGKRVLIWDGEAPWSLNQDMFDATRISAVDLDRTGRRLFVSGDFGLVVHELPAEERSPVRIIELATRAKAVTHLP